MVDTCRTLHQKEKNKWRANDEPNFFQIPSSVCALNDSSNNDYTNKMAV